jgi:hypothetical protein
MSIRRVHVALLAVAFGLSGGVIVHAQPSAATVEGLTRESQLIFQGTVERPGASAVALVKAGNDTAVVRVDAAIQVPGLLEVYPGQEVTLKLHQPGSVKAGERAVFFTRGWLYGEGLALIEAGHTASGPAVASQVEATRWKMAAEAVRKRLDDAALVVAGRVVETRASAVPERRRGTEHDPMWREAVITVDRVLKGDPRSSIVLLYPTSNDVSWHSALKPQPGQDGIWILQPSPAAAGMFIVPTALHFMAREDLATVERMVKP